MTRWISSLLYGIGSLSQGVKAVPLQPGQVLESRVDFTMWLASEDYFVTFGTAHAHGPKCDFIEDGIVFKVWGPSGLFTSSIVNLDARFGVTVGPVTEAVPTSD